MWMRCPMSRSIVRACSSAGLAIGLGSVMAACGAVAPNGQATLTSGHSHATATADGSIDPSPREANPHIAEQRLQDPFSYDDGQIEFAPLTGPLPSVTSSAALRKFRSVGAYSSPTQD